MPNFIEIGQTSLEIGDGRKKNFHTRDTHTKNSTINQTDHFANSIFFTCQ